MRSSPCAPISTTSSPTATSVSGPSVDRHVVHAHRADQRVAAAADQHVAVVGEPAPPAVAVADRHGRDPGRLRAPSSGARSRRRRRARSGAPRPPRSAAPARARARAPRGPRRTGPARRARRRSAPCRSGWPARAARRRCWRRGAIRSSRPTASTNSRKRLELGAEEVVAGLVGGGEVGHQADRRSSRCASRSASSAVLGAEPAHAGVELHVHAPAPRLGDLVASRRPRRRPRSTAVTQLGAGQRAHHQDRRLDAPGARSSSASSAVATASHSAPPASGRPAGREAVPVAVGLDAPRTSARCRSAAQASQLRIAAPGRRCARARWRASHDARRRHSSD